MKGPSLRRFSPALWVAFAALGARFAHNRYIPTGGHPLWWHFIQFLDRFAFKAFGGFPAAQEYVGHVIRLFDWTTAPTLGAFAGWAGFLLPLGFIARMVARARVRSGSADPMDRVRQWTQAHAGWTRGILSVLPALFVYAWWRGTWVFHDEFSAAEFLPIALASFASQYAGARAMLRALLTPTIDPDDEQPIEIGPDEIAFDAVAVTREAKGAIAALAGLSVAMVVWLAALPIATLFRDPRLFAAVAAYTGVAAVTATAFRFASRVAVGVDGVLVKGTSRTRFYAYRDLDAARVAGGDIELLRRGKVVLRLQLHGADATRREAVAARIRENIARVQRGESAVAAQLVSSSTQEALTRVASGGADYRAASLSRDALWALVEGPVVDTDARRAAAAALAKTSDVADRARLRVAGEHCADPRARVALAEIADHVHDEPPPEPRALASRS